ncbi:MAG: 5-formyltetrahydrofolate cyclo-ligase [Alphaproteobacteria bacterium]|nr:5-formyltetrahydrofolate cyclo-ligase [Alphaproteobacteria bacterium]
MLAWRAGLEPEERARAAHELVERYRRDRPLGDAAVVSGFWPMRDEIDLRPLMIELANEGRQLALPVVQGRGTALAFRPWRPGDPLERGVFGTLHPATRREPVEPDALLVPLLACDEAGWRLGFGGGYYDRTLQNLRARRAVVAVGVGFEAQLVPELPHSAEDQRLDWLLTEAGCYAFV